MVGGTGGERSLHRTPALRRFAQRGTDPSVRRSAPRSRRGGRSPHRSAGARLCPARRAPGPAAEPAGRAARPLPAATMASSPTETPSSTTDPMPMRLRRPRWHPWRIAWWPTVTSSSTVVDSAPAFTCTTTPSCKVGAGADPDEVHVTAEHGGKPDRHVLAEHHVPDHPGAGGDEGGFGNGRSVAAERVEHGESRG